MRTLVWIYHSMQKKHTWSDDDSRLAKKIEAIIKTDRLPIVKEQLKQIGVGGMTAYSVSGWSKGKEENLQWKGQPIVHDLISKSKLEIIVPDSMVDLVMETIATHSRTEGHGDGIVFVTPIDQLMNIKTLEKGDKVAS